MLELHLASWLGITALLVSLALSFLRNTDGISVVRLELV